jgi:thioredoxin 2
MPAIRNCTSCGKPNRIPAKHLADTGRCGACGAALPPIAEPLDVDPMLFDEIVREARTPVLVDFWAAWCRPCKMAAPAVARTAADMAGRALVMKVNTELYPQLAERFQVRGIPNFVVLHNGEVVLQQAGVASPEQMESWLKSAAANSAA